ncbi:YaiO family outer membrane beta-barrel protein [Pseudoblastomonas halimionae]|uniref:YaiO family outer membrane beta-barrel protein n=1 Tax=Alteriqipengyuania halimionae TaxID=1926630 RepID=A0A6I4U7G4_9SPHN|nr:YaiO family outer membrane beta-barrel protein [Alteriqipengyuania halimionae]MXP10392.1 YaiO family outer membrane beta-barrel protein [Alteriqipengyuania halimionae]
MASRAAILAALALYATPAFAQEDAREQASEALASGDPERAVEILEQASDTAPEDADLLRRLASAQAASEDLPGALRTIDRALQLAPQDNDIRLARARILLWIDRPHEARQQAEEVAAQDPDYPELGQVLRSIDSTLQPPRRFGVGLAVGASRIELESGTSNTWKSLGMDAFGQVGANTLALSVQHEVRAGSDTRLALRMDHRVGGGTIYLAGAVTPSADFREEWSVSAGGALTLGDNVTALLDVRHSEYAATSVTSLQPALRVSPTGDLDLTARAIVLFQERDDARIGATVRADYRLATGPSLFAGAAVYPDTEAGITRQVRGVFGGVALPLTQRLALTLVGEYEERRQSYTRKGMALGLSWRFGG